MDGSVGEEVGDDSSDELLRRIDAECIRCGNCVRQCEFLQTFATPGEIARQVLAEPQSHYRTGYFCSLCHLCTAYCPKDLPIAELFLTLRRRAVAAGEQGFTQHRRLLAYERIGISSAMSTHLLPADCDSVFFPGCSLPGLRPGLTLQLYKRLKQKNPRLGLVLDCCSKLSHDLGLQKTFADRFLPKLEKLRSRKIEKIIVGCPSCYQIFREYGKGFEICMIYSELEAIDEQAEGGSERIGACTVHDPCTLRFAPDILASSRQLIRNRGGEIQEMTHHGCETFCCGEGGGTGLLQDWPTSAWKDKRRGEMGTLPTFTLCAGCTNTLASSATFHLLDLFDEKQRWSVHTSRQLRFFPLTYLNRFLLRLRLAIFRA